ncbi:hypothetical protein HDU76_007634, partial [Blyttiomyces sp. JEL0837]
RTRIFEMSCSSSLVSANTALDQCLPGVAENPSIVTANTTLFQANQACLCNSTVEGLYSTAIINCYGSQTLLTLLQYNALFSMCSSAASRCDADGTKIVNKIDVCVPGFENNPDLLTIAAINANTACFCTTQFETVVASSLLDCQTTVPTYQAAYTLGSALSVCQSGAPLTSGSPTSSTTSPTSPPTASNNELNIPMIAGIGGGAVVLIGGVIAAIVMVKKRKAKGNAGDRKDGRDKYGGTNLSTNTAKTSSNQNDGMQSLRQYGQQQFPQSVTANHYTPSETYRLNPNQQQQFDQSYPATTISQQPYQPNLQQAYPIATDYQQQQYQYNNFQTTLTQPSTTAQITAPVVHAPMLPDSYDQASTGVSQPTFTTQTFQQQTIPAWGRNERVARNGNDRKYGNVGENSNGGNVERGFTSAAQEKSRFPQNLAQSHYQTQQPSTTPTPSYHPPTQSVTWSPDEVKSWLRENGFDNSVIDKFERTKINGLVLHQLTLDTLKLDLGIESLRSTVELMKKIEKLKNGEAQSLGYNVERY